MVSCTCTVHKNIYKILPITIKNKKKQFELRQIYNKFKCFITTKTLKN